MVTDSDDSNSRLLGSDDTNECELYSLSSDETLQNRGRRQSTSRASGFTRRHSARAKFVNTKSEEEDQILDELSLKYLNEHERITFAYYRNEYVTKAMTIDALVPVLLELLDTPEKVGLIWLKRFGGMIT